MANKNKACEGCDYNTPKIQGGYGRICNGFTQEKLGRCPEWRINELAKYELSKLAEAQ